MNESALKPPADEDRPGHLSPSDLAGFIDRDLEPVERRRIEAHLDQCAECRSELIETRHLTDAYAGRTPATLRSLRRWWVPAALAAGLATLLLLPRSSTAPGSLREPTRAAPAVDGEDTPRISIVAPAENATVAADAVVLTWHATTADAYRIVVSSDDGDPVWTGETADTTLRLPSTALRSAQTYFWRVDAIANGITATTGVHRLLISP